MLLQGKNGFWLKDKSSDCHTFTDPYPSFKICIYRLTEFAWLFLFGA